MSFASNAGIRLWPSPRTVLLFRMNLHVLPQYDMYHSDTAMSVVVIGIRRFIFNQNFPSLLFIDIYMLSSIIEGGVGCGDMVVVRGEMW